MQALHSLAAFPHPLRFACVMVSLAAYVGGMSVVLCWAAGQKGADDGH